MFVSIDGLNIVCVLAGYDFKAHDELRDKLLLAMALHSFPPELSSTYTASLAEMPEVLAQHSKLRSVPTAPESRMQQESSSPSGFQDEQPVLFLWIKKPSVALDDM